MNKPLHVSDIINSPVNKDREEVSAKTFMDAMNGHPATIPSTGKMKVHIEIEKAERDGSLSITADIDNQQDLEAFHAKYEKYMPRKKWLGVL